MKVNIESLKKSLNDNEKILSTLYCTINLGYIMRSGMLSATNERLVFIADHMFGKGLKWEFEYQQILNLNVTNGVVLEQSPVPLIKKLVMNHKDDFIVFENFSDPSKVNEFLNLVEQKVGK
jgi:hypothetical protein